jgi:hypothetical protein
MADNKQKIRRYDEEDYYGDDAVGDDACIARRMFLGS